MDYKISPLMHPAYLFIGDPDTLLDHTLSLLQKQFCKQNGCTVCISCRKIREHRHESIIWIAPEKQYVTDDLNIIFATQAFALEPGQQCYFVLQDADLLTTSCANALLKSLEEPSAGYHFILLAQRFQTILPTIKSRCLIEHLVNTPDAVSHPLFPFFITTTFQDPHAFIKELESSNPSEWQTLSILDQLMIYWSNTYKKNLLDHNPQKTKQALQMLSHLKKAMLQPPMPGSSKLFWKNLFLQIKEQ
jgi:DNA polymerase III delta prime subunit